MKLKIGDMVKVFLSNIYWVTGQIIIVHKSGSAEILITNKGNTYHTPKSKIFIYPHVDTIEYLYEPNQLLKNLI